MGNEPKDPKRPNDGDGRGDAGGEKPKDAAPSPTPASKGSSKKHGNKQGRGRKGQAAQPARTDSVEPESPPNVDAQPATPTARPEAEEDTSAETVSPEPLEQPEAPQPANEGDGADEGDIIIRNKLRQVQSLPLPSGTVRLPARGSLAISTADFESPIVQLLLQDRSIVRVTESN